MAFKILFSFKKQKHIGWTILIVFLWTYLLLFISSPCVSVLAAKLTRLGRVRLYPLKGKFLMLIQKSLSLYLPSSVSLSCTLFSLSFSAFPTFFLSYYSSEAKQSCCWRHFTLDKLSRCPSFPHSLSFTLLSIHPSIPPPSPPTLVSLGPPSTQSQPLPLLCLEPPLHVCLSGKVSDMSSEAADSVYNKPPSWFYLPWN